MDYSFWDDKSDRCIQYDENIGVTPTYPSRCNRDEGTCRVNPFIYYKSYCPNSTSEEECSDSDWYPDSFYCNKSRSCIYKGE